MPHIALVSALALLSGCDPAPGTRYDAGVPPDDTGVQDADVDASTDANVDADLPDGSMPLDATELDLGTSPDVSTVDTGVDLGATPDDTGVDLGATPDDTGVDLGATPDDTGVDLGPVDMGFDAGPQPGIVVSPVTGVVSESGGQATFTVVLSAAPTSDVAFSVRVGATSGATLSLGTLRFTAANWNVPVTVTISAVDDALVDGATVATVTFGAAVSNDASYVGRMPPSFDVTVFDDDLAGAVATALDFGLCDVANSSAFFDVRLTAQPTDTVTVPITPPTDGSVVVAPASLTFGPADWNVPQTVAVGYTGMDLAAPATRAIGLGPMTSRDVSFDGVSLDPFAVAVCDVGLAAVVVEEVGGATLGEPVQVSESGLTHDVQVRLATQPLGTVVVDVLSDDTQEVQPSVTMLVFDETNWNVPQVVSFEGIDDTVLDGTTTTAVTFMSSSVVDPAYAHAPLVDVAVENAPAPANVLLGVSATSVNCGVRIFVTNYYRCASCDPASMTDGSPATSCLVDYAPEEYSMPVVHTWTLPTPRDLVSLELDCVVDAAMGLKAPVLEAQSVAGGAWTRVPFTPGVPVNNPGVVHALRVMYDPLMFPYDYRCSEIQAMAIVP